jgi:hypothetical protein
VLSNIREYNLLYGFVTPLPFEMTTATSAAMKTGLPESINVTSDDSTATRMSSVPATATDGALLPATMITMTTAATTSVAMTASTGTLLPTMTGVAHHDATPTLPRMAPGLLLQTAVSCLLFAASRLFTIPASGSPTSVPAPVLLSPLIVGPPVGVARKCKPQVESHCCKRYWKYHVLDKPEGSTGAPPHCLDCPVRKQRR